MRSVAEHPKRVGSSVELMQVHSHTDDDIDGSDIPIEDDSDDSEDLEERIAAAHHRFEDDIDNVSLLTTASLASSPERAESGMALSRGASRSLAKCTSIPVIAWVLIGVVVFAALTVGLTYTDNIFVPHTKPT